ncbi:MAG TPA: Nif3-like dinuclear metal center hexameric protein [Chryseolinea sp.]|nr:Nif3-like dinuclear metal center hexameric protein [Chryseolinea sp.]
MNELSDKINSTVPRREFIASMAATVGLAAIPGLGSAQAYVPLNQSKLTVQQVIDMILKEIPGAPFPKTVDTLKSGDGKQVVTGIVTTMFATVEVIRKAVSVGANFIIAHEPTFYNHLDETAWLDGDPVFQFKNDLLKKNGIVVWRFHDYWHTHRPDGVLMGVLEKMGWKNYYNKDNPQMINHPGMTLEEIIAQAKKGLGIRQVRIIGDRKQVCKRIALLPGAAGGTTQIKLLQKEKPDVLIVGEVHEWETAEYVRDARAMGTSMSLIVLGHSESEEPGMEWLVPWLQPKVGALKVTHVASHNPFMEA